MKPASKKFIFSLCFFLLINILYVFFFILGSTVYLEILVPSEESFFFLLLFSPHFISHEILYGAGIVLSVFFLILHTFLFIRSFFSKLARIITVTLFAVSLLLLFFNINFLLAPGILPPWWLTLFYSTVTGLITVFWHVLIFKASVIYWRSHYLKVSFIDSFGKDYIQFLLQIKPHHELKKKLFRQYVADTEFADACTLFSEHEIELLDVFDLQALFESHYKLQLFSRAALIGEQITSFFFKESDPDSDFIKKWFLSCFHAGNIDKCLELYHSSHKILLLQNLDKETVLSIYQVVKQKELYDETIAFLEKEKGKIEEQVLLEILQDFLQFLSNGNKVQSIASVIDSFFLNLSPYRLYYYILHLKKYSSVQSSFYDLIIRFYKEFQQPKRLQCILEEYFFSKQPFKTEYYNLWKNGQSLTEATLRKMISLYPANIEPYRDYFHTLTSNEKKWNLLQTINAVTTDLSGTDTKAFQGLASTLKKELQQARKVELQKLLKDSLENHDAVSEYLIHLAELKNTSDTYLFLERLKGHFEKEPTFERLVWDVIKNYSGSFHIGDNMTHYYLQKGQPERFHELIRILSEYSLEKERYYWQKCKELHKRFPHYLPVYPELMQFLFQDKEYADVIELGDIYFEKTPVTKDNYELYQLYLLSFDRTNRKEDFISKARRFLEEHQPESVDLIRQFVHHLQSEQCFEEALLVLQKHSHLSSVVEVIAGLEEEYSEYKKNLLKSNIEKNETDYKSYFELGKIYMADKNWDQSFICFQKCFVSDQYKRLSLSYGALTLARKNLLDLSEELLFQVNLNTGEIPAEELTLLKDIFYDTAQIFDENKLYYRSVNIYLQIFKIDANFRDVMKKIENYDLFRKGRKKQG